MSIYVHRKNLNGDIPKCYRWLCLIGYCIAVKRHYDQGDYQKKHLVWGRLTLSEVQSINMVGSMGHTVRHGAGVVIDSYILTWRLRKRETGPGISHDTYYSTRSLLFIFLIQEPMEAVLIQTVAGTIHIFFLNSQQKFFLITICMCICVRAHAPLLSVEDKLSLLTMQVSGIEHPLPGLAASPLFHWAISQAVLQCLNVTYFCFLNWLQWMNI